MEEKKERGDYKTRAYFLVKEVLLSANGEHLRAEEIYDILRARGLFRDEERKQGRILMLFLQK